jgi:antitoxin component YwqK of YwqJK toxin-antitoxin module
MFSIIRNGMEHIFNMKNDMVHGKYVKRDMDGNVLISCSYLNGLLHGLYERWIMVNGSRVKVLDTSFALGVVCGPYKSWYGSGRRYVDCTFLDGKYNGLFTRWYENGCIALSCNYVMGKMAGKKVLVNYSNGVRREMYELSASGKKDGLYQSYYPNGEEEFYIIYSGGKKNGVYKKSGEDGVISEYGFYKMNCRDGIYSTYFANGILKSAEEYHDGSLNGQSTYVNGRSYTIVSYKNGKMSGGRREYHSNGNKKEFSHWRSGEKHGPYLKFSEDGKMLTEAEYSYGKLNGTFKEWFPNGRVKKYIVYKNGEIVEKLIDNEYDMQDMADEGM